MLNTAKRKKEKGTKPGAPEGEEPLLIWAIDPDSSCSRRLPTSTQQFVHSVLLLWWGWDDAFWMPQATIELPRTPAMPSHDIIHPRCQHSYTVATTQPVYKRTALLSGSSAMISSHFWVCDLIYRAGLKWSKADGPRYNPG